MNIRYMRDYESYTRDEESLYRHWFMVLFYKSGRRVWEITQ